MTDASNTGATPSSDDPTVQPLRDGDTSIEPDPALDPAQAEWDATTAREQGAGDDSATATGADPAEIAAPDDEIPAEDIHVGEAGAESQGEDAGVVELGEDGEGDLGVGDL